MELKATLYRPYTDTQRLNFIVKYNHELGYEIRNVTMGLEAWGKTQEEIDEETKQVHINKLIVQLNDIDLKTIRSLRAIQSGHSTQQDNDKLAELEQQAEDIRRQIRELQGA